MSAFNQISYFDYERQMTANIQKVIEQKSKEYILGIDEEEFKNYLISEYILEPLSISAESETVHQPIVKRENLPDRAGRGSYPTDVYYIKISYNFSGSAFLFRVHPTSWVMHGGEIYVDEHAHVVSHFIKVYDTRNPEEFKREKTRFFNSVFSNVDNVNKDVEKWNTQLPGVVMRLFKVQKDKYLRENDFFAAIDVKVNQNTATVFSAPTIKKKVLPQPSIPKNKEFVSEPAIAMKTYNDILKTIYDLGKGMETKPSTYLNKDEEGLRDHLLLLLEHIYEAITATGETFNRGGKTDIILKHAPDNSNVFVAECKFWHGESEFQSAISQLFEKYLSWRDSKTALILFVTNKDFTNVLNTIKESVKSHDCFVKENGTRGESSFSYIFNLPQDKNKQVFFEVIAFHFDK
ncbi:MAG: hypothetical protein K0R65_844 [Crocinitomicaceae bacterium]|nr:hypothetical protein [Crocinitomicaceae bacterium]